MIAGVVAGGAGVELSNGVWSQVGNSFTLTAAGAVSLEPMEDSAIAVMSDGPDFIRTLSWDGTDWTQAGNALAYVVQTADLARLDAATMAAVAGEGEIDVLSWDGADWTKDVDWIGAPFESATRIAGLTDTTIAHVGTTSNLLRTMVRSGSTWAQSGSTASLPTNGNHNLTALNGTTVAVVTGGQFVPTSGTLRTFSWDGSTWSQVGNTASALATSPHIAALDEQTVIIADIHASEVNTYRWDGSDWATVGTALDIPNSGQVSVCALNPTTFAIYDQAGARIRTFSSGAA